jgi:hypothetical protein
MGQLFVLYSMWFLIVTSLFPNLRFCCVTNQNVYGMHENLITPLKSLIKVDEQAIVILNYPFVFITALFIIVPSCSTVQY